MLAAVAVQPLVPARGSWGDALMRFDPHQGWWFLNLGRNMIYPTEAFYHAVFFMAVACVLTRRYVAALVALIVESASHPFTGIQLLAVVAVYAIVETVSGRMERPPRWFTAACVLQLCAHAAYYLFFLPRVSMDHRVLEAQWMLPWTLPLLSMLFAYGPVAAAAVLRLWREGTAKLFGDSRVRFALIWFVVSVLLAKHELFITPRQPLHFTRGYIWTPLALVAAPLLEETLRRLIARRGAFLAAAVLLALLAVADNAIWLARVGRQIVQHRSLALYQPVEAPFVYERLSAPDMAGHLVVTNDALIAYLSLVHTPLRAWYAHPYNSPHATHRWAQALAFFAGQPEPAEWRTRSLVLVVNLGMASPRLEEQLAARGYTATGRAGRYVILTRRRGAA